MTNRLYVRDWAPYRYLVAALLQVKPIPNLELRKIEELEHPACTAKYLTPPFVAFNDTLTEPAFTILGVAEALDRKFPEVSLCGESPSRRGYVRSLTHIIDEGFSLLTAGHIRTDRHYLGPLWHASSEAPLAFEEGYQKKFAAIESCCADAGFLLGDRPYLPDVMLAASCWFAEDRGLPPVPVNCPKLAAWVERNARSGPFSRPV